MTREQLDAIRSRWQLAVGPGPDDVRALLGEVDRLRGIVGGVEALLEDPWIDDTTHIEMLVLEDVAAVLKGGAS